MPGWTKVALPKAEARNTLVTVVRTNPVMAVRAARPCAISTVTATAPRTARAAPKMLAPRWLIKNTSVVT